MSNIATSRPLRTSMTPEEARRYRTEGFLNFGRVLSDAELAEARQELDNALAELAKSGTRPEQMHMPHVKNPFFYRIVSHPRLLDIVQGLIGPDIVVFASHMICKPGGDGREVPWHQDGEYWPLHPMDVITCWMAFDDADTENGCMRVIPGSHVDGMYPHFDIKDAGNKVLSRACELGRFVGDPVIDVVLKAGECSFHDPWVLHGSNANISPRRRAGYTIRFMPASTRFVWDDPRLAHFRESYRNHPLYLVRGQDRTGGENQYVKV